MQKYLRAVLDEMSFLKAQMTEICAWRFPGATKTTGLVRVGIVGQSKLI